MLIYITCTNFIKITEFWRTEEHLEISRFAPSMKELRWRQAHIWWQSYLPWELSAAVLYWANIRGPIRCLEKAMAPHSSTLAWKIPSTEEPGRLQSMESLGVGHDWVTSLSFFAFHFHALEKEMATHSSVLAWRIPGTEEPGGLLSMGLHRVRHDWSDLAVAVLGITDTMWKATALSARSNFYGHVL